MRPCPFCASTFVHGRERRNPNGSVHWAIVCALCNAEGPPKGDLEVAKNAWNDQAARSAVFEFCVFKGNSPKPHKSWNEWVRERPLTGVTIEAMKAEDWK